MEYKCAKRKNINREARLPETESQNGQKQKGKCSKNRKAKVPKTERQKCQKQRGESAKNRKAKVSKTERQKCKKQKGESAKNRIGKKKKRNGINRRIGEPKANPGPRKRQMRTLHDFG